MSEESNHKSYVRQFGQRPRVDSELGVLPNIVSCTTYGIKGTLSEAEAFLIRERLQGGIRNKASRGELYHHIPVGYVRGGSSLRKDPDRQVQNAVEMVFCRFLEQGSARQTIQALRDAGVRLPSRRRHSDKVEWVEPTYERVRSILSNPAMGGAYAYGRQRTERIVDDDSQVRRIIRRVAREDWQVLAAV